MNTHVRRPLGILHVLRAPLGGLFRHVIDLARGQAERGHRVGIIADGSGGASADAAFAALEPILALGVARRPMGRHLSASDVAVARFVARRAAELHVDVVHGHGAKGGAFARLLPRHLGLRVYTPHGGSLHYKSLSPAGLLYLTLERMLAWRTDLFLFESEFGRTTFATKIGAPRALAKVVHNGLAEAEFEPATPLPDATDLLFIGELRMLKGLDVLIDAVALVRRERSEVSLTIVGDGPDRAVLQNRAGRLGGSVRFAGPLPAREAFRLGRIVVVPSRAESLPYIVLEAAAARMPLIATQVGGIPEIFGDRSARLVAPNDSQGLAAAIDRALSAPYADVEALAARVRQRFSREAMVNEILTAYGDAMERRRLRALAE